MTVKAAFTANGAIELREVDIPDVPEHAVLVRTEYSGMSLGTELMLVRSGITAPLGNGGVGIVERVGSKVANLQVGQRVACYGVQGHAEYMLCPKLLAAPVPDGVSPQEASYAGLGTVAVHALRKADLRFGETVIVVGLGILGQMIALIAKATGLQVLAVDLLESRGRLLQAQGIRYTFSSVQQLEEAIPQLTDGHGADCVLICSGNKQAPLLDQSIRWIRDRGEVILVGDSHTQFDRNALFGKEGTIAISRAGGPGRYDPSYEQAGVDYPIGYVRWTEGRNLACFLRLLSERQLVLRDLITHTYRLQDIHQAYRAATDDPQSLLGVVLAHSAPSAP